MCLFEVIAAPFAMHNFSRTLSATSSFFSHKSLRHPKHFEGLNVSTSNLPQYVQDQQTILRVWTKFFGSELIATSLQVINDKAQEVADQAVPTAEKAADKLESGADKFAENTEDLTNKLSSEAKKTAQKVADEAVPQAEKLSDELLKTAKDVEKNAEPKGKEATKKVKETAQKVSSDTISSSFQKAFNFPSLFSFLFNLYSCYRHLIMITSKSIGLEPI